MSLKEYARLARKYGRLIAAAWPMVLAFMQQAEASGVPGAQKLEAVRLALSRAWDKIEDFAELWKLLEPMIAAAVLIYNGTRWPKKD